MYVIFNGILIASGSVVACGIEGVVRGSLDVVSISSGVEDHGVLRILLVILYRLYFVR